MRSKRFIVQTMVHLIASLLSLYTLFNFSIHFFTFWVNLFAENDTNSYFPSQLTFNREANQSNLYQVKRKGISQSWFFIGPKFKLLFSIYQEFYPQTSYAGSAGEYFAGYNPQNSIRYDVFSQLQSFVWNFRCNNRHHILQGILRKRKLPGFYEPTISTNFKKSKF